MQEPKAKTKAALPPPPAGTEDLALVDAAGCAAIGSGGISWWQEEVRAGRAPQPVIRAPRFTRWRLSDVRSYWERRISNGGGEAAEAVVAKAIKASDAARAKRATEHQPAPRAAGPSRLRKAPPPAIEPVPCAPAREAPGEPAAAG